MKLRLSRPLMTLLAPLTLAAISLPAVAQNTGAAGGGLYAGMGTTGLVVGYGQTYSPAFGSRLEAAGWSTINRNFTEGGIDYRGSLRMRRAGAALDWHPFANGFRLSAGLSWVDANVNLNANAVSGSTITVGNAPAVTLDAADGLTARVELPRTMPYLGMGWGQSFARGWTVHADLGALLGKAKVTGSLTPSLRAKIAAAGPGIDPDAELDRELQQVRDGVDKASFYPVLQLGVSYRW